MGTPSATNLASGDAAMLDAIARARKLLHKRALMAAAAGSVPIPGLDWAVDAALLSKLIPEINAMFGLSEKQIDQLTPHKREQVQKVAGAVGSMLIGKLVTRDLVMKAAKRIGVKLTTAQIAKYVPLAGTAISAAIGYGAVRMLGGQHLKDCVRVAKEVQIALPAPPENLRLKKEKPASV